SFLAFFGSGFFGAGFLAAASLATALAAAEGEAFTPGLALGSTLGWATAAALAALAGGSGFTGTITLRWPLAMGSSTAIMRFRMSFTSPTASTVSMRPWSR